MTSFTSCQSSRGKKAPFIYGAFDPLDIHIFKTLAASSQGLTGKIGKRKLAPGKKVPCMGRVVDPEYFK